MPVRSWLNEHDRFRLRIWGQIAHKIFVYLKKSSKERAGSQEY